VFEGHADLHELLVGQARRIDRLQRAQQPVTAFEELADPPANGRKNKL